MEDLSTMMSKQEYDRQRWTRYYTDARFHLRTKLSGMLGRCKRVPSYKGLEIHQEWLDNPDSFIEWALNNGWKMGLEIDRIDGTKGYAPNNCRFVTRRENARNRVDVVTDWKKGLRRCSQCKIVKPLSEFYEDNSNSTGRKYNCKECFKRKRCAKYKKNKERPS